MLQIFVCVRIKNMLQGMEVWNACLNINETSEKINTEIVIKKTTHILKRK